jgi:hypothetical protein
MLSFVVVACVCLVAVVVGVIVKRQRKRGREVLKSTEDSYSDMSSTANEVANPLCM